MTTTLRGESKLSPLSSRFDPLGSASSMSVFKQCDDTRTGVMILATNHCMCANATPQRNWHALAF